MYKLGETCLPFRSRPRPLPGITLYTHLSTLPGITLYPKHLPDNDDAGDTEGDAVDLGDEDAGHRLVQSRAVHVDGGSDGSDEANDALVHLVLRRQALHRHRQRRGTVLCGVQKELVSGLKPSPICSLSGIRLRSLLFSQN